MALKSVFYGSRNAFDEMVVDWLSRHTEVVGVVWSTSGQWKYSWSGRVRTFLQRMRKYGALKVVDEALYFLIYHQFLADKDSNAIKQLALKPYYARHGKPNWTDDEIYSDNVNESDVIDFVEARSPDIGFAMCINDYFGERIRDLPGLGTFLWHEGFLPEYRGLYSPFWTLYNLDFEHLGYSLIQMNESFDAGDIFCIGHVQEIDPFNHLPSTIGHKAIYDSFDDVARFLNELEDGTACPVSRKANVMSAYYTYPGLSDFIRQRWRLREYSKRQNKKVGV